MAAPPHKTIEDLSGQWLLAKDLSDDVQPLLKLQQVSWILRKAYARASIKLDISQYITTQSSKSVVMIDIVQTASGWASTRESRTMSGILQNHNDYIFGSVETRSYLMYDSGNASNPISGMEPKSHVDKVKIFLQGQILRDGSTSAGFLVEKYNGDQLGAGKGLWLYTISHNSTVGWIAEQTWGFENIDGNRYHTRRVAVWKEDGRLELARLVYRFLGSS